MATVEEVQKKKMAMLLRIANLFNESVTEGEIMFTDPDTDVDFVITVEPI